MRSKCSTAADRDHVTELIKPWGQVALLGIMERAVLGQRQYKLYPAPDSLKESSDIPKDHMREM